MRWGVARVKRLPPIAILLAAIAAAYWLGHRQAFVPPAGAHVGVGEVGTTKVATAAASSPAAAPSAKHAPLPRTGAPLRETFVRLQIRASAGDADAASRLFRDIAHCRQWQEARARHAQATDALARRDTGGMTAEQLRTQQILLDAAELRQRAAEGDGAFCTGVGDAMLDSLASNMALAAKLGDADARACYLGRGPLYDPSSLLAHPEALRSYRVDATAMIRAGLAAGDWRVVDLLSAAYMPDAPGLLAAALGADPLQHYRYLRLYRLGAEPHRAAALDQALAVAAAGLNSAQVAQADDWARQTLRDDFDGSSTATTPQGWEPCAF